MQKNYEKQRIFANAQSVLLPKSVIRKKQATNLETFCNVNTN